MRIYHIEHGSGPADARGSKSLFDRIAAMGIPILDNEDVLQWGAQMRRLNSPLIFNHEDWGLSKVSFHETLGATLAPKHNVLSFLRRKTRKSRILPGASCRSFTRLLIFSCPTQEGRNLSSQLISLG